MSVSRLKQHLELSKFMSKPALRKALQKKLHALWKEYCYLRDGKQCMVQKYYPEIKIEHSEVYQVDHCFSRTIKELFCDVANGTVVCSTCNGAKGSKFATNRKDAITIAINSIVRNREGVDTYLRLLEIAEGRGKAFLDWKNINWLETQIAILEEMITARKGA